VNRIATTEYNVGDGAKEQRKAGNTRKVLANIRKGKGEQQTMNYKKR